MTLYDAKRIIGMKITDEEIINMMNSWPFDVVADADNNPLFSVPLKDGEKHFKPIEVSSEVLRVVR